MKNDTRHTAAESGTTGSRPSLWRRFLAWLARGAAAAQNDRRGACPT